MNEKILWTLREHAMKIIDFKNKKMKFEKIYGKVRNHCHFTDEYRGGFFFSTYTVYNFSNKNVTVTRYLYIWMYLRSQSKSHYKIDR